MEPEDGDPHRLLDQAPLLDATRERPLDRSQLQHELDISRSTAYRRTSSLKEDGLLDQTPAGYQTTGAGCAVADAVEQFERSVKAIDRLEPLLAELSEPELTRNVHLFADADVFTATPANPNEPIDEWVEHFEYFERFRGTVVAGCPPAVTEQGVEHAQSDVDFEAICSPLALQADKNASQEAFETIAGADSLSLYTHPAPPFTMGIIDDVVIIIAFDEDTSLPVASITTTNPLAREWAEDLYRRYRRDADTRGVTEMESSTR